MVVAAASVIFWSTAHSFAAMSPILGAPVTATIKVSNHGVGQRPAKTFGRFLGVHSLFWETQGKLTDSTGVLRADAIDVLKSSGVRIIRNGGGANEIDWRLCRGPQSSRAPQKVASWIPPVRCQFGIMEYETSIARIGTPVSWHIANIVGLEFNIMPANDLADSAGERARFTRAAGGDARQIYWELGNEVERGRYPWTPDEIFERMHRIGSAISRADPNAILVVPLLEYRPPNIDNEYRYNEQLMRRMRDLTHHYALHVYYENPPEGPSLRNRLKYIRDLVQQLRRNHPEGQLWVTEHARWPKGSPRDGAAWRRNWHQTTDEDGVLSTAGFLAGISQIDGVAGAMWHGLQAGPWNFVDVSLEGDVRPGTMAKLFGFLNRQVGELSPVSVHATPTLASAVLMNHDYHIAAFSDPRDPEAGLRIMVVNRGEADASFAVEADRGAKPLSVARAHHYSPARGIDHIKTPRENEGTGSGTAPILLTAPARHVSVFLLK